MAGARSVPVENNYTGCQHAAASNSTTYTDFFLLDKITAKARKLDLRRICSSCAACRHLFPCPFPPRASMQNHPAETWAAAYHIPAVLFWLRTRAASQIETSPSQFSEQNGRGNLIKMAKPRRLRHVCLIMSRFTPDSAVHLGEIRSLDYSGLTYAATVCTTTPAPSQIPSRSIKCLQVYCSNEVKWQNTKVNKLGHKRLKQTKGVKGLAVGCWPWLKRRLQLIEQPDKQACSAEKSVPWKQGRSLDASLPLPALRLEKLETLPRRRVGLIQPSALCGTDLSADTTGAVQPQACKSNSDLFLCIQRKNNQQFCQELRKWQV